MKMIPYTSSIFMPHGSHLHMSTKLSKLLSTYIPRYIRYSFSPSTTIDTYKVQIPLLRNLDLKTKMELSYPIFHPFLFLYQVWQFFIAKLLSPSPPVDNHKLGRPKIAIIGAGLTGVSAASHCVGHGFDVQIFEAGPRSQLGGIWSVCLPPPFNPEIWVTADLKRD